MNTHLVELAEMPYYPASTLKQGVQYSHFISQYLAQLLEAQRISPMTQVKIPSLEELAKFFKCTQMNVYDAFQTLRDEGYDYYLAGMDQPILFWCSRNDAHTSTTGSKGQYN
jgi:DNA-binding transcriptional MocR family regulator